MSQQGEAEEVADILPPTGTPPPAAESSAESAAAPADAQQDEESDEESDEEVDRMYAQRKSPPWGYGEDPKPPSPPVLELDAPAAAAAAAQEGEVKQILMFFDVEEVCRDKRRFYAVEWKNGSIGYVEECDFLPSTPGGEAPMLAEWKKLPKQYKRLESQGYYIRDWCGRPALIYQPRTPDMYHSSGPPVHWPWKFKGCRGKRRYEVREVLRRKISKRLRKNEQGKMVWRRLEYWQVVWADGSKTWEHSLNFDFEMLEDVTGRLELEDEDAKEEEEEKEKAKPSPPKRRKTECTP
jgi:hypothetical protein